MSEKEVAFSHDQSCQRIMSVTGATTLTGSSVVDGTGQIVLDNLRCRNTESRLVDCPHNGLGVHNCVHSDDAGVRCLPPLSECASIPM